MAKKSIKAEVLTPITSRYHGSIYTPAAEDQPPTVLEWPLDDSEESQAFVKGLESMESKGFIKIVRDKVAGKLESKTNEVKS